jgi:DnaJ-class molecular chaperone
MTLIDSFIEFQRDETGRTPATEWVICSRCHGDGTLGGFAGAYTEEDRAEWSEEDYESYRNFRRHCDDCDGDGKVRTIPADSPWAEAWAEWVHDEAADRATQRAESGYAW